MTGQQRGDDVANGVRAKRTIVQRVEVALAKLFKPDNAYHPEQHYLRGRPGPKAQAKHEHEDRK
jgi:hypothetical protein